MFQMPPLFAASSGLRAPYPMVDATHICHVFQFAWGMKWGRYRATRHTVVPSLAV